MTTHSRTRHVAVAGITGACLVLAATPAVAVHDHHIVTPGTCVGYVADGQTSKSADDPGGHVFHNHVHMRTASNGTRVAELTDGRVHILKTDELNSAQRAACGVPSPTA